MFPTVVSLDPGGTTGWCVLCVHPLALVDPDLRVLDNVTYWRSGQYDGIEWEHVREIENLAAAWEGGAVVVEDFVLRRLSPARELLSPVRLTAALEYVLWREKRLVFRQSASDAKTICTDERLKDWGFYRREGGEEHARDATRHGLLFLRRASTLDRRGARLRRAAWPRLYDEKGAYAPEPPTPNGQEERP